jgi:hypothetical protein
VGLNIKGWIYILSNESFPHLVKIGYSERDPQIRVSELFTTGIPTQFKVEYSILIDDACELEKLIHEKLADKRHSTDREFFKIPVLNAIEVIRNLLNSTNRKIHLQEELITEVDNLIAVKQRYLSVLNSFSNDLLESYNSREKHYLQIFEARHDSKSVETLKSQKSEVLEKLESLKKDVAYEIEKFIAEISGSSFAIDILDWYITDAHWKTGSENFYNYLENRFAEGHPLITNMFRDINSFDYTQLLKKE